LNLPNNLLLKWTRFQGSKREMHAMLSNLSLAMAASLVVALPLPSDCPLFYSGRAGSAGWGQRADYWRLWLLFELDLEFERTADVRWWWTSLWSQFFKGKSKITWQWHIFVPYKKLQCQNLPFVWDIKLDTFETFYPNFLCPKLVCVLLLLR
jgi:hypothetical protein